MGIWVRSIGIGSKSAIMVEAAIGFAVEVEMGIKTRTKIRIELSVGA